MRKVPYLIIGRGRLATHFSHYLRYLQIPFLTWDRKENTPDELAKFAAGSETIFLAIADAAISPFIVEHPYLKKYRLVHASGSQTIPGILGAHPLFTFSGEPYDLASYQKIVFVIDQDEIPFEVFMPGLKNQAVTIRPENKPLYHALCVMAGNFTVLLWQHLFKKFEEKLNLPAEIAKPYLEQIVKNLLKSPMTALTGPITRGDTATIEENCRALEGDAFQAVYRAFLSTVGVKHEGH